MKRRIAPRNGALWVHSDSAWTDPTSPSAQWVPDQKCITPLLRPAASHPGWQGEL